MRSALYTIVLIALACGCKPLPPSTATDVAAEVACVAQNVESGMSDPVQIGLACSIQDIALVSDIMSTLAKHAKFARMQADAGR